MRDSKLMKVLVTGAAGLIGREVVVNLRESGHEPIASDLAENSPDELVKLRIEYRSADITDFDQFLCALDDTKAVIHCAAIFDLGAPASLLSKVNVDGVETVCKACVKAGIRRLIHLSTVGVYGRQKITPIDENAPKYPHNNYERSKWFAEQIVIRHHEEFGLPVSVLRPTLVYGPGAKYGLAMFAALMSVIRIAGPVKGFPLVGGGPMTHFVHVEDVAKAAVFLLDKENTDGEAYNVADLTPICLEEASEALINRFGLKRYGTLPYIPAIWKPLVAGIGGFFGFATAPLNGILKKTWKGLIDRGEITDALNPRIDYDWIGYGDRDFIYSNQKLLDAGYAFEHPQFLKGFEETMNWYMDNRWLPDFR